jgi:hypothetical protein
MPRRETGVGHVGAEHCPQSGVHSGIGVLLRTVCSVQRDRQDVGTFVGNFDS